MSDTQFKAAAAKAADLWKKLTDTQRGIIIGAAASLFMVAFIGIASSDSSGDKAAKLQAAIEARALAISQLDKTIAERQDTLGLLKQQLATAGIADVEAARIRLQAESNKLAAEREALATEKAQLAADVANAEQLKAQITDLQARKEILKAQVATIDPSKVDAALTVQDFSKALDFNGWQRIFVWQTQRICYTGVSSRFCYGFEKLDPQAQENLLAKRGSKQFTGMSQVKINGDNNVRQIVDWDADLLIFLGWNGNAGTQIEVTPFGQLNPKVRDALEAMRPNGQ
ncbi:MAG: hypothetical protein GC134_09515 [Proteobacteria bacterium]|nr:hypothetical protein [Pseudomonadota bacterium]